MHVQLGNISTNTSLPPQLLFQYFRTDSCLSLSSYLSLVLHNYTLNNYVCGTSCSQSWIWRTADSHQNTPRVRLLPPPIQLYMQKEHWFPHKAFPVGGGKSIAYEEAKKSHGSASNDRREVTPLEPFSICVFEVAEVGFGLLFFPSLIA